MNHWQDLLTRLSEKLFEAADEYDLEGVPDRIETRWLGFPGATEDAIVARERALGVQLPSDYRDFLRASNGFQGLAGLPHGLCSLLAVEDIGWMREKDRAGRLDAYLEAPPVPGVASEEFVVDPHDYARTVLIGESDGNECILLLPPKQASGTWVVWTYHPECGFEVVETFTELMESSLEV